MKLSEVNIYPVKSLKGISVSEAVVEDRGLKYDRRWMLVDKANRFLTQREFPRMASISVAVAGDRLVAKLGPRTIEMPRVPETRKAFVQVWDSHLEALEYDQKANRWFSEALGTECRLVAMPEDATRKVNPDFAVRPDGDVVSFADGYPFLLIGEGSLADLNSRLSRPVPMNRFRPNLVISGSDAFAEDTWRKIKIGDTIFHMVKPCARCVTTTVDQARGQFDGKEPLKTLATYRNVGGNVMFGQNLIAEMPGGTLRTGDRIEILETRD